MADPDLSILTREDLEYLLRSTSRDNKILDNELNECKENLERIQREALESYNRLRRKNINIIGGKNTRKLLPKLRKIDYTKKKHRYHIKDSFSKRKLAIHEGVNAEAKKTKKNKKHLRISF